jgi:alcohol dehydrogenase class IV
VEFNCLGEPKRFAEIARALGKDVRGLSERKAAALAAEAVYEMAGDLEIPTLQALGFAEDEIPMLAEMAARDAQSIGNPRDVDAGAYARIYTRAFATGKR